MKTIEGRTYLSDKFKSCVHLFLCSIYRIRIGKPWKVFGAYATAIEEPWDGVIHSALLKAQESGEISYEFVDEIGYSGDMERILRETAEDSTPAIIFGDAFGNEEAVRRVAKDYPDIAFVFGSGLGPSEPNLSVFDNWIHEPAYLSGLRKKAFEHDLQIQAGTWSICPSSKSFRNKWGTAEELLGLAVELDEVHVGVL